MFTLEMSSCCIVGFNVYIQKIGVYEFEKVS